MKTRQLTGLLMTTALLLWSLNSFSSDQFTGPNRDLDGNIVPTPKGEKCVEPTADMRANHMKYLLHKRDDTVHQGIRTKKHSLTECINCHVTPGKDGSIARVSSDQHFCSSCHRSVSVKLDCFECHADRPVSSFSQKSENKHDTSIQVSTTQWLANFLQTTYNNKPHVADSVANSNEQQ